MFALHASAFLAGKRVIALFAGKQATMNDWELVWQGEFDGEILDKASITNCSITFLTQ